MNRKLEFFLTGNFMPILLKNFVKEVTLIKVEAERLKIPYESYHPYYVLVYSYIKKLMKEEIIVNDNKARGSFHKVWVFAEDTDDVSVGLQNMNHPLTEYAKALLDGRRTSSIYVTDKFQYDRNIKRLHLIIESIRQEAVEEHKHKIGMMERVAFFYNTLCFQDPCHTADMNVLWAKLNQSLRDPKKDDIIFDPSVYMSEVVKNTYLTAMKCWLCQFGVVKYVTEPDFYRHVILTHTCFRLKCDVPKCEATMVNRMRMEKHLINDHPKMASHSTGHTCKGCGRRYSTLAELNVCEETCVKSHPAKLSIYHWEKFQLIWSGQDTDGFTLDDYFFTEKPVKEPEIDESLFDISFGSDFENSGEEAKKEEPKVQVAADDKPKTTDSTKEKPEVKKDEESVPKKAIEGKGADLRKDQDKAPLQVKIMTATEALTLEGGVVSKDPKPSTTRKRKGLIDSTIDEMTEVGDLKRALLEQQDFLKTGMKRIDEKLDKMFEMIKKIKKQLEK